MGGHHKKNLRAEKAKIKLKGAKLPKGLNVTKTEFKVRKIIIKEQISESKYIDGERQVNLKETLTRLRHHSSKFRLDALRALREAIIIEHPGVLRHLNEVIQGTASICLDLDRETRRESFRTLGSLLGALSAEKVAPFFHIISSYLRCAMTHIQPTVQDDALLMLDVLLQHVPHMVASHSAKIFQNFLEMISRVRAEGDRANRTLTIHMGQKQSTIKWRTKVLQRLQQMLQTLVEYNRRNTANIMQENSVRNYKIHTFNPKEPQYLTLKRTYGPQHQQYDIHSLFTLNTDEGSRNNNFANIAFSNEGTSLRNYLEHLMPLLLETWLEARPQESSHKSSQVVLTHDAAMTLKIVLAIIESLWSLVDIHEQETHTYDLSNWLRQEYAEAFATNFLQSNFPYQKNDEELTTSVSRKSKKSTPSTNCDQLCVLQNLSLTHLLCRFFTNNVKQQATKFSVLLQYLNTIVCNLNVYSLENYRSLEAALRAYLLCNGLPLLQIARDQTHKLLCNTIKSFLCNRFPSKDGIATKELVLLCEIVQNPLLFEQYGGAKEFHEFLTYLPKLLLRPTIPEVTLLTMSNLGKRKNNVFLLALANILEHVIENIQKIQVVGAYNAFEGKKHIMNLYYWIECQWSKEQQIHYLKKIEQHITDKRIVSYFKYILMHKNV